VNRLVIVALGIATGSAAANTVVKVTVQVCSPSPNVAIAVTQLGKSVPGAKLDIYREIENGERPSWTGVTDKHGVAKPPELRPGKYRVVADSGRLEATMFLTVTDDAAPQARCEIKLTPPDASQTFSALARQAVSIRVREFRGVVQDDFGAVIPHTKIRVLRKKSPDDGDLASTQSDERGQFLLPLREGTYLAVFEFAGFKRQVVGITVAKNGWEAFLLTMAIYGSATNAPPEKWNPTN
jgi:hypothetical protein